MSAEHPWIASFAAPGGGRFPGTGSDLDRLLGREDLRVLPLKRGARGILQDLPSLGPAIYTTRNSCVSCSHQEAVQAVLPVEEGAAIFGQGQGMRHLGPSWRHAMAVLSRGTDFSQFPPCLLFFGESGDLAHQVTLSDPAAWEAFLDLVRRHQGCWNCLRQDRAPTVVGAAFDCPARTLRQVWCEAGSEGDLEARLKGLGLPRLLALRALEGLYTRPLATGDLTSLLQGVRDAVLPIHVQVGNRHCTQALEGPLEALALGPGLWEFSLAGASLRLDPSGFSSLWSLVRPGPQGEQRRFECYDAANDRVLALSPPLRPCPPIEAGWQGLLARFDHPAGTFQPEPAFPLQCPSNSELP